MSDEARIKIKNLHNQCYVSMASIWEIAIKSTLGKLQLNISFETLKSLLIHNNIALLPINFEHIQHLLKLPMNHSDPFDRLIIAQAICEDITVVTKDAKFELYDVTLL